VTSFRPPRVEVPRGWAASERRPTGTCRIARPPHGTPARLVTAPVQFNEKPAGPERAPEFNENGDSISVDIGLDIDAILDLKIRGVVG
jgi:hypothetical protein